MGNTCANSTSFLRGVKIKLELFIPKYHSVKLKITFKVLKPSLVNQNMHNSLRDAPLNIYIYIFYSTYIYIYCIIYIYIHTYSILLYRIIIILLLLYYIKILYYIYIYIWRSFQQKNTSGNRSYYLSLQHIISEVYVPIGRKVVEQ